MWRIDWALDYLSVTTVLRMSCTLALSLCLRGEYCKYSGLLLFICDTNTRVQSLTSTTGWHYKNWSENPNCTVCTGLRCFFCCWFSIEYLWYFLGRNGVKSQYKRRKENWIQSTNPALRKRSLVIQFHVHMGTTGISRTIYKFIILGGIRIRSCQPVIVGSWQMMPISMRIKENQNLRIYWLNHHFENNDVLNTNYTSIWCAVCSSDASY